MKRAMGYKRKYQNFAKGLHAGRKYARPLVNTAVLAAKAYTMAKALKRSNNIEYKYMDYNPASATVDFTGTVTSMIPIPQNTTDTGRIGDSLKLQNLTLRYYVSNTAANSFLRVMIIHDDQNKITGVSDVLQSTVSANSVLSPKNYDKRFQNKILYDRVHNINSAQSNQQLVDKVIRLGWHAQYSAASTTVLTGDLKILVISNANVTLPSFFTYSRISYTDN